MNTQGAFSYWDLMKMELSEFKDVVTELNIRHSKEKLEDFRVNNHANAVGR
jgi:hypothetical protein